MNFGYQKHKGIGKGLISIVNKMIIGGKYIVMAREGGDKSDSRNTG